MIKGVDLSRWNKVEDFKKVKADGYDFVILRAGGNNGGYYRDPKFDEYYEGAKSAGLKIGAYYDTGKNFIRPEIGYECALHFSQLLHGKTFDFPVYADIETVATVYKKGTTDCFVKFATTLEKLGFYVGVYASDISGFKDRLKLNDIQGRFTIWCARYGKKPEYVKKYDIWQKSSSGSVNGIDGNVDIDVSYKDFSSVIKKKGLNGYGNC